MRAFDANEIVVATAIVTRACARGNGDLDLVNAGKAFSAAQVADEVLAGSTSTRVVALPLADRFGHPDPPEHTDEAGK